VKLLGNTSLKIVLVNLQPTILQRNSVKQNILRICGAPFLEKHTRHYQDPQNDSHLQLRGS